MALEKSKALKNLERELLLALRQTTWANCYAVTGHLLDENARNTKVCQRLQAKQTIMFQLQHLLQMCCFTKVNLLNAI